MLNLAFYPYFTTNWWTIYDFPVKKEPDIPAHSCRRNAGHKMHAAGLLGQLFLRKIQNGGRKWFEVLTTAATIYWLILEFLQD